MERTLVRLRTGSIGPWSVDSSCRPSAAPPLRSRSLPNALANRRELIACPNDPAA